MAVVFMEGFDHLSEAQLVAQKGWVMVSNSSASVAGRYGGMAARVGNALKTHALPAAYTTLYVGCAINSGTTASDDTVCLMALGAQAVRVQIYNNGSYQALRFVNAAGTQLAIGTTQILPGVWYHYAIKAVASTTVGTVELRLNGSPTAEMAATGVNTGANGFDAIRWQSWNSQQVSLDDLYALDTSGPAPTNDWIGDCRIETIRPTGDGTNTAWANGYVNVADSASNDGDGTFISSSTPGAKETYGLTDLSITAGTVFAVQTNLVARKADAGAKTIAPVIRIGVTDYDGTTTGPLADTYVDYRQLYDRVDPSGADWTIATVNAMEAGVKEVA